MQLHKPHSERFVTAWKSLVMDVFRWRAEGPFVCVPSLSGGRTLSYLPLLSYSDLTPAGANEMADQTNGRNFLIRVLSPQTTSPKIDDPVTMRLPLAGRSADAVWTSSLKPACRRHVRKSQRGQLSVSAGRDETHIGDFLSLLSRTLHRYGAPMLPADLFDELAYRLDAVFYKVTLDNRPVASMVALRDEDIVWVPWVASDRKYFRYCPNHLMYWRAIEDAIAGGAAVFDFGRSPYGGNTYRFKTQWGAQPVAINLFAREPISIYSKFNMARRLWRLAPRPLADYLGPRLCRYLAAY